MTLRAQSFPPKRNCALKSRTALKHSAQNLLACSHAVLTHTESELFGFGAVLNYSALIFTPQPSEGHGLWKTSDETQRRYHSPWFCKPQDRRAL